MIVLLHALLLLLVRQMQWLLLDLEVAVRRIQLVGTGQRARLVLDYVVDDIFRLQKVSRHKSACH